MIAIAIVVPLAVLVFVTIFLLFYFGMINCYHPMKKAKENQVRIACVGDSLTYGLMVKNWHKNNYPTILNKLLGKNYCVNNYSYTNRTLIKSGDYPLVNEKVYKQSLDFKPNIVLILLGTNDSKENNWNKEKFISDYSEIIDIYLSLDSSPKLYIMTPPPVFKVRGKVLYKIRNPIVENEIIPTIKQIAESKNVACIDVYEIFKNKKELFIDGIHLKAKGCHLLAQHIFERLKNDNL